MDVPSAHDILFWLTRSVHPAVVAVISIFVLVSAKAHKNPGWMLLYLGWLSNIAYLLLENFGRPTASPASFVVSEIASTATGGLFLQYVFTIRKSRGAAGSPRWAWLIAVGVLSWSVGLYALGTKTPALATLASMRILGLLPQVVFMATAITWSGRALGRFLFDNANAGSAKLVSWPWIGYGLLQPAYLATVVGGERSLLAAMTCALGLKFLISIGLYKTFVDQVKRHQEEHLAGWQSRAFSWFAHELKNPAYALRTSAQAVMRRLAQRDYGRAAADAMRLVRTTNILVHVVESVKIAAEPLRPERLQFFSVNDRIDQALRDVQSGFVQPPILTVTKSYARDLIVCADPDSLTQVFINVLRNAIEASSSAPSADDPEPVRHVNLEIETKGVEFDGEDGLWDAVRCRFIDHGPGIDREEQADVFKPYVSTKAGVNRGLGLWVVRRFVGMFGGRVTLKSPVSASNTGVSLEIILPRVLGGGEPATFWREAIEQHLGGDA